MSRFRFPMASLEFLTDITLPAALWHWGRLSLFCGVQVLSCTSFSWINQGLSRPVEGMIYLLTKTQIIIIVIRWARHVARMGEERGAYRVLVGKLEGKRPLGRLRRRWVDNIRMDLQ